MRRSSAGRYLWTKHVRSLMPTLILVTVAAFAMPVMFFILFRRETELSWGLVILMLFILVVAALIEPLWTRWWEKNHGNQEKGARGEIAAGKELEKLHLEGFHIFHDYKPENFGNVDHFLIGDKGVFVIETKAWSGEISTDGYDILVNGRRSRYSPISQAKSEATRVRHLLQKSGGIDVRVRSILCFTGDELRIYGKVRGVEVTSLGALRRSVMQLSVEIPDGERLSQSTVRVLSRRLSQHLSERPAASPGNPPEPPGKMKKLRLKADKIFVAVYIAFIFALTLIFAGDTAVILDDVANLYHAIYLLSSNL